MVYDQSSGNTHAIDQSAHSTNFFAVPYVTGLWRVRSRFVDRSFERATNDEELAPPIRWSPSILKNSAWRRRQARATPLVPSAARTTTNGCARADALPCGFARMPARRPYVAFPLTAHGDIFRQQAATADGRRTFRAVTAPTPSPSPRTGRLLPLLPRTSGGFTISN